MKKAVSLIISLILALSVSVFFVGCAETPCSHTWNEGEITTAPSLTAEGVKVDGVKTFTCTSCQETKTESVPYLGFVNATEFDNALAVSNFANAIVTEDCVHNFTVTATSTSVLGKIVVSSVAENMNEKTVTTYEGGKIRRIYEGEGGLVTTTTLNGTVTTSVTPPSLTAEYYTGDDVATDFETSFFATLAGDTFDFEDFEYNATTNVYTLKETVVTDEGNYTAVSLKFENGKLAFYDVAIAYDNVEIDITTINGTSTVSGSVVYGTATAFNEMYHITVFKPDGTRINGLTEGWGYDRETNSETVVTVQYCAANDDGETLACTADVIILGENGTVEINKNAVDFWVDRENGTRIKFQINGINEDLYVGTDVYAYIDIINPYSLNFYLESVPQA